MQRFISYLFAILLFFTPLILWPHTSEIFEFNKMIFVYAMSVIILAVWIIRCVIEKRYIFRRTILDYPLVIYLTVLLISTLFSIDPRTSWLGYYSRFNGGFLSVTCYITLYWAFVSNMDRKSTLMAIRFMIISSIFICLYGIAEHFGIDKNIWVQDVQSRVFSTLGQPNWLAAYIGAILPITIGLSISKLFSFKPNIKLLISAILSVLLFTTLLFTKSRSGLLGFILSDLIFWSYIIYKFRQKFLKEIIIFNVLFLILFLAVGSPLLNLTSNKIQQGVSGTTALETGGTESGTIRKIVWKGAIDVWKHYPIVGSGPETFAYSYYLYRPAEHNLTSEWNYLYNKAHNEYLNLAATTGALGLISYLVLIAFSIRLMFKSKSLIFKGAVVSGYVGLLLTNFFGFSVVPTQIELFLFPAFIVALGVKNKNIVQKPGKLLISQKFLIFLTLSTLIFSLFKIADYWRADVYYNNAKILNSQNNPSTALPQMQVATSLAPKEAVYHAELARIYANLAVEKNNKNYASETIKESDLANTLSPANVNLRRIQFSAFITLTEIDPNYLTDARDTTIESIKLAPTDPKLYYNLGLTDTRLGGAEEATSALKKAIELKANYKEARLAYAIVLIAQKKNPEAKIQLEYILKNIDPQDTLTKQTLEEIK